MPELTPLETLQPCLLDRLTDDAPGQVQEGRSQRVVSISRYKEAVLRDLVWLFNTPAQTPGSEVYDYPEAARSIMNFGYRSLCGLTMGSLNLGEMERQMLEAIRTFEPRIISETLSVKASMDAWRRNMLVFEIKGELWARPMPEQLWLKTVVDLDTGRFLFGDRLNE